ncbi:MAG TPA: hypothetical protein VI408_10225 [Gaiellaceae bacterium]
MKKLLAAITALAALFVVSSASADPMRYGVADDWPKFHACGDVWWNAAKDIGYQDLRMTVQWDESTPTVIQYQANLQLAIDCAVLNNMRPILSIYPLHPAAIGSNTAAQGQFASFVALVGQAFPSVTNFIVGNEPNVNRFWQPQYAGGHDAAATDYEHTLAASYDALKTVRPDSVVWGPAISSRGNDNATATSNPSHSPVWFIKYMGDAYRASGRTKPIFDEFNMHPYPPVQDADPFSKPFQWPQAGAANLDRIKQALWDAFNGTGQPVPAEQPGGRTAQSARFASQGLPMNLDEAGEQTTVTGHEAAYNHPPENVQPIDEATQAVRHVELAHIGECDPDVKAVLWFPLIDDTGLSDGFQSGNMYADLAHKQSYTAMQQAIGADKGNCVSPVSGISTAWTHTTQVVGAQAIFGGPGTAPGSQPTPKPATLKTLWTSMTATEDASYTVSLLSASAGTRRPAAVRSLAPLTGSLQAYYKPGIKIQGPFPPGTYMIQIVLKAATNPSRTTTLTSKPFTIGTPAKPARTTKTSTPCKKKTKKGQCIKH